MELERQRLLLQADLDSRKTQSERNRRGQFSTPGALAKDILAYAATLSDWREKISFLDPALGTGAFYAALRMVFPKSRIKDALGFEIDPHYGHPAARLWGETGLRIEHRDFTAAVPAGQFNLIICNPPYVRHHHLDPAYKMRLQAQTLKASGMMLSGLAGLYCHFLGLSHAWMAPDAIAGWLVPSEFMDVNYGGAVKQYLLERVTLLHVHRFDPREVQFADALVSSAVVWFRNTPPRRGHHVKFSFGGTLLEPGASRMVSVETLAHEPKWTRFPVADVRNAESTPVLADFFSIKRGLATGDNRYFILSAREIAERRLPEEAFTPILPSPRHLVSDEVHSRTDGSPDVEPRLFLLNTRLDEAEIQRKYPSLFSYLQEGKARGLNGRYLCKHRRPWYAQERRDPAPIVCTYLGRGEGKRSRPFRFILNWSRATVANVYLAMYPNTVVARAVERDPSLMRKIWRALNALPPEHLLGEGRVYGGGLHKLEPRELANVRVLEIAKLLPSYARPIVQRDLLNDVV
jgi:hypothetical protein